MYFWLVYNYSIIALYITFYTCFYLYFGYTINFIWDLIINFIYLVFLKSLKFEMESSADVVLCITQAPVEMPCI